MSKTIAISGKGGTGKTTLATLVIRWLLKRHQGNSILAVDADPNANLDDSLGVKAENSIVAIVDDIAKNPDQIPQGITRDRYLDYQIQDSLVEAEGFDLLTMGRPEGPGCYCAANNLLRTLIEKLNKSYFYIVIDNEAGMEHLSRRTTRIMDLLFIISDYSVIGLRSAKRILDLTRELKLNVKDTRLVINRAPGELNPALPKTRKSKITKKSWGILPLLKNIQKLRGERKGGVNQLKEEIDRIGIPLAGIIPEDKELLKLSLGSGNLGSLSGDSKVVKAVDEICEGVL